MTFTLMGGLLRLREVVEKDSEVRENHREDTENHREAIEEVYEARFP